MERQVLITECMDHLLTTLLEDGKPVEFHFEPSARRQTCQVGEIYVGKVQHILPNIHGAFIEIGDGLSCYYSLEEKDAPVFTHKIGKKPLCIGDELLVQVQKEAVKTKQPVVTGNLSFTGKYVVLTSGNRKIGVSNKLPKAKREELLALASSACPEAGIASDADKTSEPETSAGFGLIFRTNAGDAAPELILEEIQKLSDRLHTVLEYGKMRTCFSCLYKVPHPCIAALRDVYKDGLTGIIVDAATADGALYQEAEAFLREEQPEDLPLLRPYNDPSYPLAKCYSLETAICEARKEKVWMKSGGYLVIQPTEALTVIDVNSGKCQKKQKEFAAINREAAVEAARQIRLRNLSGIIIIDFINMKTEEERSELLAFLQKELNKDPNPANVVGMTKLQLVEITRKKIHKTLEESLHE